MAKAKAKGGWDLKRRKFAKRMHVKLSEVIETLEDDRLFGPNAVPGDEMCVPEPFDGVQSLVEIAHNILYQAKVQLQLRYREL